jgi:hypothetical protein
MSNPHEELNRAIKADKLVDSLTAAGQLAGQTPDQIATGAKAMTKAERITAAEVADCHPASDETWALVVHRLTRRAEIAASDPFAGLPQ